MKVFTFSVDIVINREFKINANNFEDAYDGLLKVVDATEFVVNGDVAEDANILEADCIAESEL